MIARRLIFILISCILCFQIVFFQPIIASAEPQMVIVNLKRHIYHTIDCNIAKKCKKDCLATTQERAVQVYRARPCKICHRKHIKKKTKHTKKKHSGKKRLKHHR